MKDSLARDLRPSLEGLFLSRGGGNIKSFGIILMFLVGLFLKQFGFADGSLMIN